MSFIQELSNAVGAEHLIDAADEMAPYLVDERGLYRGRAACVVLPGATAEVAGIVQICRRHGLGIVPQGGNTGYCGGASPDGDDQVLVNLSRMNRILDIDPVGHTATVQAGVVLAELRRAAAERDLLFPLSMGSEGSCQIGGALSTNAGGLAVLHYGTARELVLGLEAVLPSGAILGDPRALRKDNTGYDLKSLFLGAEGTLGIVTAAVLKLFPAPTAVETAWLAVDEPRSVRGLLSSARRLSGDTVTSFEYISRASLEFAATHIEGSRIPLAGEYEHQVLLELSAPMSGGALRAPMEAIVAGAMEDGLALDGVLAESESQRRRLWRIRETIPEAERCAGGSVKHDVSVAVGRVPEYLAEAPRRLKDIASHRPSIYGHVGDGNLHYNILAPADEDPAPFRERHGRAFSDALHALAVEMGGSFSAEHGIGKLKKAELENYKDPTALQLMRDLKRTLDPDGLMNPGKML